jgi:hypothetical protein
MRRRSDAPRQILPIRNRKRTLKANEHTRQSEERHAGIQIQGTECFVVVVNGIEHLVHSAMVPLRTFAPGGWRKTRKILRTIGLKQPLIAP